MMIMMVPIAITTVDGISFTATIAILNIIVAKFILGFKYTKIPIIQHAINIKATPQSIEALINKPRPNAKADNMILLNVKTIISLA